MVEKFSISCQIIFGDIAKNIFYEFDVVFMKEHIKHNGYLPNVNFSVIKGQIRDTEGVLNKLFCDEDAWIKKMDEYVIKDENLIALNLFKERVTI